jgi:hypothetical protein
MQILRITAEEINPDEAEKICRTLTANLPDYFGLLDVNEICKRGSYDCMDPAIY